MDTENELHEELERWKRAYIALFAANEKHIQELAEARCNGWAGVNQNVLDMFEKKIIDQAAEIQRLRNLLQECWIWVRPDLPTESDKVSPPEED